ncbi:hypothetical protein Tco_0730013 [Tanacetum coccineum]|uniref:Uncharacterized protein n=1 Tax=Tanacetum coccineum TaxID=301880 RepID=A0ABQ4YRE0_9ASTR
MASESTSSQQSQQLLPSSKFNFRCAEAASFQKPLAFEVPLTSHMLKVSKLFEEPKQSLIPPSGEVIVDDTADKSLSKAFVQPVTQPKAPTDLKTKKKKNLPSSKHKSPYKRLEASKSADEQVNQPTVTEAEKDVIDITPKGIEERDASESLSGLRSMPDDDLAAMIAQSDPLVHLLEELCLLNNKVEARVQKNLQDQLPNILMKPMYKEFNAFNKLESWRFILLQKELSKSLHNKIRKSIRLKVQKGMKEVQDKISFYTSIVDINSQHVQDLRIMFEDMVSLLEAVEVFKKANGDQPSAQVVPNTRQAPPVNEEKALVLHTEEKKSSEEDTSGKKETNDEPTAKKLKFLIPSSSIPSPTPLKSIMPQPPKFTEAIKMTLDQFTEHLSKITSSIFSPTPLREPTPSKDQTPPRVKSKGKSIATEDPLMDIMPFMEEGGSAPKISSLKSFVIPEETLNQEKVMARLLIPLQ